MMISSKPSEYSDLQLLFYFFFLNSDIAIVILKFYNTYMQSLCQKVNFEVQNFGSSLRSVQINLKKCSLLQ